MSEDTFELRTKTALQEMPHLAGLQSHLLAIGGEGVVLWADSNSLPFVNALLESGLVMPGKGAKLRRGARCECHENSIKLFQKNPSRLSFCTGYALSGDGIWRPHSWVFDKKNKNVIETTVRRLTYYGMENRFDVLLTEAIISATRREREKRLDQRAAL